MKKLSLLSLFFVAVLAITSCKKEENNANPTDNPGNEINVPEVNTALVQKHTGSKCPPCGGWGWAANEDIMNTNKGNAVFVGAFSQNFVAELFITQVATDFDAAWGVTGYPTWSANGVAQLDRPGGSVNTTSEKAKVKAAVDAHKAAPVVANTGFTTAIDGDKLTVNTRTKFFKDGAGEYYLAVYVMEDKVVGKQSGHPSTPNVTHPHVLRGSATLQGEASGTTWGKMVAKDVTAGFSVNKTYIFDVTNYNKANLQVATVIWKKNGTKYEFVNANSNQVK